jgi:short-subunit dehydrogenase
VRALLVGASAGVGRALSEVLAAGGHDLLLVASDARDLEAQASHLRLTYGVRVEIAAADASCTEEFLAKIVSAAKNLGEIQGLFFPIGVSRSDDIGTLPAREVRRLIDANMLVVMAVVGHFLPALLSANTGCIVGFGSIAAVRGRGTNIVYAAAKRGLASYFESLRHLAARSKVRVQFYQLGYVESQQTYGRRLLFRPAHPAEIAAAVGRNLDRDIGVQYLPCYWALITRLLRAVPWTIFKRLSF